MHFLSVHLFGKFCVKCWDQPQPGFESGHPCELFSYLLLHRERPQQREVLADALWGDQPKGASRKHLRQALWQLNAIFTPLRNDGHNVLAADANWVSIDPYADLWLDTAIFEQACDRVKGVPGNSIDPPRAENLHEAISLYRGELLEGCYHDWCLLERERFRNMYLMTLDKLMVYHEASGEYEAAIGFGNRALAEDPAHESTHRRMMRLYCLAGDRTAALRQYERCEATLYSELSAEPAASTVALYEQIRRGQKEQLLGGTQIVSHLKRLQTMVEEIQAQLSSDIRALE